MLKHVFFYRNILNFLLCLNIFQKKNKDRLLKRVQNIFLTILFVNNQGVRISANIFLNYRQAVLYRWLE